MKITDLLKIQSALLAAENELHARGEELRRLQDVEMIPLSISVTGKAERDVRAASELVQAALDEKERQAQIADKAAGSQA